MDSTVAFVVSHGYVILFVWVLMDQLGVPVPAVPVLLAVGALIAAGEMTFALASLATVAGSLVADMAWYGVGRWRGIGILQVLCKRTLEPDSCVRRNQDLFRRYGAPVLLIAKLVPGLSAIMAPLAGVVRISLPWFVLCSAGGSVLWLSVYGGIGYLAGSSLDSAAAHVKGFGRAATLVVAAAVVVYLGVKWLRRRRVRRRLRLARLPVDDLKTMIDRGEQVDIVDLRSPLEVAAVPYTIPGARRMSLEEIEHGGRKVAADRDVVLFCDCPHEATSARAALALEQMGYAHIRPLAGGFEAWRKRQFPLVPVGEHGENAGVSRRPTESPTM